MGTNNPYLPDSVRSDEAAIQYLAMMVNALKTQAYVAKTGAGPFNLTAAEMVNGVVEHSGQTAAISFVTPSAAALLTQMQALDANAGVGSKANFTVINDNTSSGAITITGGTGVTFVGGATPAVVPIATARRYQIEILTATTASLTVVDA